MADLKNEAAWYIEIKAISVNWNSLLFEKQSINCNNKQAN